MSGDKHYVIHLLAYHKPSVIAAINSPWLHARQLGIYSVCNLSDYLTKVGFRLFCRIMKNIMQGVCRILTFLII